MVRSGWGSGGRAWIRGGCLGLAGADSSIRMVEHRMICSFLNMYRSCSGACAACRGTVWEGTRISLNNEMISIVSAMRCLFLRNVMESRIRCVSAGIDRSDQYIAYSPYWIIVKKISLPSRFTIGNEMTQKAGLRGDDEAPLPPFRCETGEVSTKRSMH